MITWIQRYFQHHFKIIFAVLLAGIIIAFVFTIGAAPGIGQADRQMVDRHFFGYNLGLQSDQQRLIVDAYARYRITDPLKFYQNVRDEQRVRDVVHVIGGRDEHHLRKVERHVEVTVDKRVVLPRVEHLVDLRQRRERAARLRRLPQA